MTEDMKAAVGKDMQNSAQPRTADERKTFRKLADVILEYIAAEIFLIVSNDLIDRQGNIGNQLLYLAVFIAYLVFQTRMIWDSAEFVADKMLPEKAQDHLPRILLRLFVISAICIFLYYLCAGYSVFFANLIWHVVDRTIVGIWKTWRFAWQHAGMRMHLKYLLPVYIDFFPSYGQTVTTMNLIFSAAGWWEYIMLILIPMRVC